MVPNNFRRSGSTDTSGATAIAVRGALGTGKLRPRSGSSTTGAPEDFSRRERAAPFSTWAAKNAGGHGSGKPRQAEALEHLPRPLQGGGRPVGSESEAPAALHQRVQGAMAASDEPHQLGSAGNGRIAPAPSAPVASRPSSAAAAPSSRRSTSMRESLPQSSASPTRDAQTARTSSPRPSASTPCATTTSSARPSSRSTPPAPSSSARQEATVSSMARRVAALPTSQAANAADGPVRGVLLSETRLRWAN